MANKQQEIAEEGIEIKPLPRGDLKLAEYTQETYVINPKDSIPRECLDDPKIHGYYQDKLRSGDILQVIGFDKKGAYWAELLVADAEPNFDATFVIMRVVDFPKIMKGNRGGLPEHHFIEFFPDEHGYRGGRQLPGEEEKKYLTALRPKYDDARFELMRHATLANPAA